MDVDIRTDFITEQTKKLINQAMGRDKKKLCNICQHEAPSVRRHKEHCRGHFLQFVCPCGHNSFSKETTRKHQLRATRANKRALCAQNIICTVDQDSFTEWRQATKVPLPSWPSRSTISKKKKITEPAPRVRAPTTEINTVRTSPPRKDGRPIMSYKQPRTFHATTHKSVPSTIVARKVPLTNTERQMLADLRTLRHGLSKIRKRVDKFIDDLLDRRHSNRKIQN